jgi:hypothetical protein
MSGHVYQIRGISYYRRSFTVSFSGFRSFNNVLLHRDLLLSRPGGGVNIKRRWRWIDNRIYWTHHSKFLITFTVYNSIDISYTLSAVNYGTNLAFLVCCPSVLRSRFPMADTTLDSQCTHYLHLELPPNFDGNSLVSTDKTERTTAPRWRAKQLSGKRKEKKIWSWAPTGCPTPRRIGRLSIGYNINSTRLTMHYNRNRSHYHTLALLLTTLFIYFMLVSCFADTSTLKMEVYVPPKRRLTFNRLHIVSQMIELFIISALRPSVCQVSY